MQNSKTCPARESGYRDGAVKCHWGRRSVLIFMSGRIVSGWPSPAPNPYLTSPPTPRNNHVPLFTNNSTLIFFTWGFKASLNYTDLWEFPVRNRIHIKASIIDNGFWQLTAALCCGVQNKNRVNCWYDLWFKCTVLKYLFCAGQQWSAAEKMPCKEFRGRAFKCLLFPVTEQHNVH